MGINESIGPKAVCWGPGLCESLIDDYRRRHSQLTNRNKFFWLRFDLEDVTGVISGHGCKYVVPGHVDKTLP